MTKNEFNFYLKMSKALQSDLASIELKALPNVVSDYINFVIIILDDVDLNDDWDFYLALDKHIVLALILNKMLKIEFPLFSKYIEDPILANYRNYRSDWKELMLIREF